MQRCGPTGPRATAITAVWKLGEIFSPWRAATWNNEMLIYNKGSDVVLVIRLSVTEWANKGCCFYIIVKKNRSLNMSQVNDLGSIHPTNGWYCCSYLISDMSEDETASCRIPSEKRRRFRVAYTRLREKPGWVMRCRLTVPYQRPSPDGVHTAPPYFILTPPQYAGRRDLSSTI